MRVFRAFIDAFIVSNPWRPHVRDARGVERPVCSLKSRWFRRKSGPLPPDVIRRVRASLIRSGWTEGLGPNPAVFILLILVFLVLATQHARNEGIDMMFFGCIATALLLGLTALTRPFRLPRVEGHVLAMAILRERHCPVCAFPLQPSATESVCPECGSHWVYPDRQAGVGPSDADAA